jgi:hypothetical protein
MTTQVIAMNKLGLAVASDSSLTISRGDKRRTYGSAEKILLLGPSHMVVVLHSGVTEFMDHPFEVLITEWKRTVTKPLQKLEDYADSFINWISHRQDLFDEKSQIKFLSSIVRDYLLDVRKLILQELESASILESEWKGKEALAIANNVLKKDLVWLEKCTDLAGLGSEWCESKYPSYKSAITAEIEYVFDDVPRNKLSDEQYLKICKYLMYKNFSTEFDATLVVAGYGEQDIYPSSIDLDLKGLVADKPRYSKSRDVISTESGASVTTQGQSEAIHTFLRAFHPSFKTVAKDNLNELAVNLKEIIMKKFNDTSENSSKIEDEIDDLLSKQLLLVVESFESTSTKEWVDPFVSTLVNLPIVSLAKTAESLVELQILRQSTQAVQDTVGGAIDVAVVTRDLGIQWFKHKTIDDLWRKI